jgi:pathogenesis-related protein 1
MLGWASRATAQTTPADALSRDMLAAHNRVRASVGVPPLKWSEELAAVARQWAEQLLVTGKFAHRPKPQYGENLFEIRGAHATPAQVVAEWAVEAREYDATQNKCRSLAVCGHYTQVVWRGTKQVGCGVARRQGREVWVCNYDPPGNWVGERPY